MQETVTIIPARGGSKGIPRKNLVELCGKPLIAWSILQAQHSSAANVFVTTDDDEIAAVSERYGARIIRRPLALADDRATSESALQHALARLRREQEIIPQRVVFLQPTSPLREPVDIDGALEAFGRQQADSLFSAAACDDVCLWHRRNETLESFSYDYRNRGRRQDREPLYLENGSIYIFKPEILETCNNRLGGSIVIFEMPLWKSHEIDHPDDVGLCEYLLENRIRVREAGWYE